MRTVALPDGTALPALGLGTWKMGEAAGRRAAEADALRLGISLGMTLIDTAEMYADGGAETVTGDALQGQRDRVFVVSKVLPQNASRRRMAASCEASLRRLRIDCLDLYLLHWQGSVKLAETVDAFEALRAAGKIHRWGVSNLDLGAMQKLAALPGGTACATNQVLYNLEARGIEFDLLPYCASRHMPVMAYSPVGQAGRLLRAPALRQVAERHGRSPAQVALAWTLRHPEILSIPKAADPDHVRANAEAASLVLSDEDCAALDAAFPPPRTPRALEML
jgi:diketogulonate reductase-like aldo/keto reductase